jgi:hypothetical protein
LSQREKGYSSNLKKVSNVVVVAVAVVAVVVVVVVVVVVERSEIGDTVCEMIDDRCISKSAPARRKRITVASYLYFLAV